MAIRSDSHAPRRLTRATLPEAGGKRRVRTAQSDAFTVLPPALWVIPGALESPAAVDDGLQSKRSGARPRITASRARVRQVEHATIRASQHHVSSKAADQDALPSIVLILQRLDHVPGRQEEHPSSSEAPSHVLNELPRPITVNNRPELGTLVRLEPSTELSRDHSKPAATPPRWGVGPQPTRKRRSLRLELEVGHSGNSKAGSSRANETFSPWSSTQ